MGRFINTGNQSMKKDLNASVYVDKSKLISFTNSIINARENYVCVSRPRRFGKSMAANMLSAYYDELYDSRSLFKGLAIEHDPSFEEHLNKYPVVKIDLAWFISDLRQKDNIAGQLKQALIDELRETYPEVILEAKITVSQAIAKICKETGKTFIFIIDEWDAVFRELPNNKKEQESYLNLLRSLFKSSSDIGVAIALCYMTGILPIKKYNTQSTLNNFSEFTMIDPLNLASFVGFTEEEVKTLCEQGHMDFQQMKRWYDGYSFSDVHSVYSPFSVVNAIRFKKFKNYWTSTSSFNDARDYINMNFDGLKDSIIRMVAGERCHVNTRSFDNDFVTLHDRDQVLTLLIHLGYLAYDEKHEEAYIPNLEVSECISDAIQCSR